MEPDRSEPYPIHILEMIGNAIMGGVEQYVHNLARHLPEKDFKITIVAPYESAVTARLRELGSLVYVTHMDDNPQWRSIQFLTELVNHQHIDLIHAHMPRAQVLAGLVGCLTNTPVVNTIHGMDITAWELGIARTTHAHVTVVCQEAYAQALALGLAPDQVTMVPNGVDLRTFRPSNSGAALRKSLELDSSVPLIGYVGRLSWEKGPDLFVQLAQHVHQIQPQAHFVMVGGGPMLAELQKQVEAMGLQEHFHFAGVWTQMSSVYPALDVLVQTSRVEGMPFSLLEAMGSGVPVAAMNAGGVGEVVEVGTTGYLAAVGDWAGLGDAVARLIGDPDLCRQMGHAARRRAEQRFDLNTSLELLAQIFRARVRCTANQHPTLSAAPAAVVSPPANEDISLAKALRR